METHLDNAAATRTLRARWRAYRAPRCVSRTCSPAM